jgi:hypothetical protein
MRPLFRELSRLSFSIVTSCLATVIAVSPASADVINWAFSISGAGIAGSGITTTSDTVDAGSAGVPSGGYDILGITGTLNGQAIVDVVPQQLDGPTPWGDAHQDQVFAGPQQGFIPLDGITTITSNPLNYLVFYDNVLFRNSPQLDGSGLLFTIASDQPNQLWNLYSDSGTYFLANVAIDYPSGNPGTPVSFAATPTATPVPEPASFALLGSGLLGFGFLRRRKDA